MNELHDRLEAIAGELTGQPMLPDAMTPEYKEVFTDWMNATAEAILPYLAIDPQRALITNTLAAFSIGHAYALKHGDIREKATEVPDVFKKALDNTP